MTMVTLYEGAYAKLNLTFNFAKATYKVAYRNAFKRFD